MPVRRFLCEGIRDGVSIRRVVSAASATKARDRFVKKHLSLQDALSGVKVKTYGKPKNM